MFRRLFCIRVPIPRTREEIDAQVEAVRHLTWAEADEALGLPFGNRLRRRCDSGYYRIVTFEERERRRKRAKHLLDSL